MEITAANVHHLKKLSDTTAKQLTEMETAVDNKTDITTYNIWVSTWQSTNNSMQRLHDDLVRGNKKKDYKNKNWHIETTESTPRKFLRVKPLPIPLNSPQPQPPPMPPHTNLLSQPHPTPPLHLVQTQNPRNLPQHHLSS